MQWKLLFKPNSNNRKMFSAQKYSDVMTEALKKNHEVATISTDHLTEKALNRAFS